MTDFTISCLQDPSEGDATGYAATYRIRVGGDDVYRACLSRSPEAVRPSRFETRSAGFLPFEINQTSTIGFRKFEVREAFAGARIGEIRGLKLYFDDSNQVVDLYDPASPARRLVRRVLRGRPDNFVFRRAVDRAAIGWVEAPPSAHGSWPMRFVKAHKRSGVEKESLVWQGQLDSPDLDLRLFIAAAVVVHSDQESGGGPRGNQGPRR